MKNVTQVEYAKLVREKFGGSTKVYWLTVDELIYMLERRNRINRYDVAALVFFIVILIAVYFLH